MRRLAFILALLSLPCFGAVAYDNSANNISFGSPNTTASFTIGSGANRVAVVHILFLATTTTTSAVTVGGVSGTLVTGSDSGSSASGLRTMTYCVINPPSGSKTASVTYSGGTSIIEVLTFTGADQTTGCNNGTFGFAGFGTSVSKAVTSTSGDMTTTGSINSGTTGTNTSNQTARTSGGNGDGADTGPGTGTATHTWSNTTSGNWCMSGVNVMQAGGGGGGSPAPPTLQTMGVGN